MAIEINRYASKDTTFSDFSAIREAILTAAREAEAAGKHDSFTVELDGTYHFLTEPLVLSATENPELLSLDITLRSRFSRGATLQSWRHAFGKDFVQSAENPCLYTCQLEKEPDGKYPLFHELFLNGKPIETSFSPAWKNRVPLSPEERRGEVKRKGLYVPLEIAEQLAAGECGSTELLMEIEWQFASLHATGVDLSDTRDFGGVPHALVTFREGEMDYLCTAMTSILNIGNRNCFFKNSPAFLSEPNTYAYDYERGVIYLLLDKPTPPELFAVEYATLENLIHIEGLENVTLEDLCFTGVTSKYVCEHPYLAGQANCIVKGVGRLRHAAILLENVRNVTVRGCSFDHIGCNGVQSVDASVNVTVENCIFKHVGMCAVTVGNPSSVWDEPKNRNYNVRVLNNYFEHIAYDYPASPCIYLGMVDGLEILHNTIRGCAYSGMSVGWGWASVPYEPGEKFNVRDAEIAYNYIENFMDMLRDGGAIYVLGGNANPKTTTRRFNRMHDNFAILAKGGKGEKYGYYCDGSSSNWDVYHNVMVGCAHPLFSQHTVPSAYTYHNHIHDIYVALTGDLVGYEHSHAAHRDVYFYDINLVEGDFAALAQKHPAAADIRAAAGCTIKY